MEEEAHDKDLKSSHGDDEATLDQADIDDALLSRSHRAEVTVLPGAEVFLVSRDGGKLARDLENGLLKY